jgi:hypothetical protein
MGDEDALPSWDRLCGQLRKALNLREKELDRLFAEENTEGPFLARHARMMMACRGPEEVKPRVTDAIQTKRRSQEQAVQKARKVYRNILGRYKAALERQRRSRGLPGGDDLDRIQRYEAHLERGLHKALDRLQDLQAARGAVPPRPPSLAVAVVQAAPQQAPEDEMAPIGSFALEAPDGAEVSAEMEPVLEPREDLETTGWPPSRRYERD